MLLEHLHTKAVCYSFVIFLELTVLNLTNLTFKNVVKILYHCVSVCVCVCMYVCMYISMRKYI